MWVLWLVLFLVIITVSVNDQIAFLKWTGQWILIILSVATIGYIGASIEVYPGLNIFEALMALMVWVGFPLCLLMCIFALCKNIYLKFFSKKVD